VPFGIISENTLGGQKEISKKLTKHHRADSIVGFTLDSENQSLIEVVFDTTRCRTLPNATLFVFLVEQANSAGVPLEKRLLL